LAAVRTFVENLLRAGPAVSENRKNRALVTDNYLRKLQSTRRLDYLQVAGKQ